MKGRCSYRDVTPIYVADTSTSTRLSAAWVGVAGDLKISKSTSFGVSDMFFTTSVTLENVGDNTLFNVAYMRNVDPDQEQVPLRARGSASLLVSAVCGEPFAPW